MTQPSEDATGRKQVLVVEDEVLIAMELEDALRDGGFDVLGPAGSVNHALNLLNDERPHAAVLDVTLGREKVTPVALLLKSLGVPFILASASDAAELARHHVLADALNLGKPTDLAQLVEVVRGL